MTQAKSLRATFRELKRRNRAPYDGVLGQLPDWMPSPLAREFEGVRNRLLRQYTVADVREWLRAAGEIAAELTSTTEARYARGGFVPPQARRDIESLRYIRDIQSLGPEEGIKAYLGGGAFEVLRGRTVRQRQAAAGEAGGKTSMRAGTRRPRGAMRTLIQAGKLIAGQMLKTNRRSIAEFKRRLSEFLDREYEAALRGNRASYPFKASDGTPRKCPRSTLHDYLKNHKPAGLVDR